jgi:hypothetical protein
MHFQTAALQAGPWKAVSGMKQYIMPNHPDGNQFPRLRQIRFARFIAGNGQHTDKQHGHEKERYISTAHRVKISHCDA